MLRHVAIYAAAAAVAGADWSGQWGDSSCSCTGGVAGPSPGAGVNMTTSWTLPMPSQAPTGYTAVSIVGDSNLIVFTGSIATRGSFLPVVYAAKPSASKSGDAGIDAPASVLQTNPTTEQRSLRSTTYASQKLAHTEDAATVLQLGAGAVPPGYAWATNLDLAYLGGYPTQTLYCDALSHGGDNVKYIVVTFSSLDEPGWSASAGLKVDGTRYWMNNGTTKAGGLQDATCGGGRLVISTQGGYLMVVDVRNGQSISYTAGHPAGSVSIIPSGSATDPAQFAILTSEQWGVAEIGLETGEVNWNVSGSGLELIGQDTMISPDGSLLLLCNYTNVVALSTTDGSVVWTWYWPKGVGLGGTDLLTAWSPVGPPPTTAAQSTHSDTATATSANGAAGTLGTVILATNMEDTASPYTEFGAIYALDGGTGALVAQGTLGASEMFGGGSIVVDDSGMRLYATTWTNPEASSSSAAHEAPIPTTYTTLFTIDYAAAAISATSTTQVGIVDGNLRATYAIGPQPGQLTINNGSAVSVIEAAAG